jgi:hypothetical protein
MLRLEGESHSQTAYDMYQMPGAAAAKGRMHT